MTSEDDRKLLETLKSEMDLITTLGSEGSAPNTLDACSLCQAAKSCLMCYGDANLICPLHACVLMSLVPPEYRSESVPCHHIPLTAAGEGIEALESWCTQRELEEFVKIWLRRTIQQMENDKAMPTKSEPSRVIPDSGVRTKAANKGNGPG